METTLRKSLDQDFFITGANVVTEDGRIISVDGVGNRIAGMIFGAKKVILVLGQNKIVKDLVSAFGRIEKVISPGHAKHRGFETPCVQKGECVDCRVKERICNVIAILEGRPMMTDITVILVGETRRWIRIGHMGASGRSGIMLQMLVSDLEKAEPQEETGWNMKAIRAV
jgi:hypothetical protein